MSDLDPRREGYKLVGEEIVTLPLKLYRVTEEEFKAAKRQRLNRYQTYDEIKYSFGNFMTKYFIIGSYDEFNPHYIIRKGDTVELKKYIWEKI